MPTETDEIVDMPPQAQHVDQFGPREWNRERLEDVLSEWNGVSKLLVMLRDAESGGPDPLEVAEAVEAHQMHPAAKAKRLAVAILDSLIP